MIVKVLHNDDKKTLIEITKDETPKPKTEEGTPLNFLNWITNEATSFTMDERLYLFNAFMEHVPVNFTKFMKFQNIEVKT